MLTPPAPPADHAHLWSIWLAVPGSEPRNAVYVADTSFEAAKMARREMPDAVFFFYSWAGWVLHASEKDG